MDSLPSELLTRIFEYSRIDDVLLSFRLTSSGWLGISNSVLASKKTVTISVSRFQKLSRSASSGKLFQNRQEWLDVLIRHSISIYGDKIRRIHFDHVPHSGAFMLMNGANTGEASPWVIMNELLSMIYAAAPDMMGLDFGFAEVVPDAYSALSKFSRLRSLSIHDATESFGEVLNLLPNLRSLTISGVDAPLVWPGSVSIRELCVRQPIPASYFELCGDNANFERFADAFPNLRVHLDGRTGLSIISPIMGHGISAFYKRLTALKTSTVLNYFCTFRVWTPSEVAPFSNLRALTLKITRQDRQLLENLHRFPRLRHLRLWFRTGCPSNHLLLISSIPSLRSLQMRDFECVSDVDDAEFAKAELCSRLRTLRVWAQSDVHMIRARCALIDLIRRSARHLKVLQLFPGQQTELVANSEWKDFMDRLDGLLVELAEFKRLECLETPVIDWPLRVLSTGIPSIRKLALDIDASSLQWLSDRPGSPWSAMFPRLEDFSLRFRGERLRREIKIARFLDECPTLRECFIDVPCLLISKSWAHSIGSHSRLQKTTITDGLLDPKEKIGFDDLMRFMALTRLQKMRTGFRLPVLQLRFLGLKASKEVVEDLAAMKVLLE